MAKGSHLLSHEKRCSLKLAHLRYFEHLAAVLNYTKAAKDLYIAQPTLSAAIKRMEQELGLSLFRRIDGGTSQIELTEQGIIFLGYVRQALDSYDIGVRKAQEAQDRLNNVLCLGTVYSMKGSFWSQAIDSFFSGYEKRPQIHMEQAYSPDLARQLKAGEIDVAFAALSDASDGLDHKLVWTQSLVACVNKNNPLAQRESVSFDDLVGHRLLTYSRNSSVSAGLDTLLEHHDLDLVRGFDDEITLSSFVSSDEENIALLVYSVLVNAFDDVVCLPIRDVPHDFHKVYLLSRKESHTKIVSEFIDFMSSYHFPDILQEAQQARLNLLAQNQN